MIDARRARLARPSRQADATPALRLPRLATLGVCTGALLLAACASSPPSHFYTLGAGPQASAASNAAPAAGTRAPALLIEVAPVDVPPQVARNQLVVQTGDARVDVLEQQRWVSPPAEEIRRALSGDLAARLGTFDVYGTPYPDNALVYRISVNVRRFESWPDARAVLEAVFSVRSLKTQAVTTCRTVAEVPVGAGYDALVEGHRRAVARLADDIARTVNGFGAAGGGCAP